MPVYIKAPLRKRLTKSLLALCDDLGAKPAAYGGLTFETPMGSMWCGVDVCETMLSVFCRYDDVDAAWQHHMGNRPKTLGGELNPYSGKFNLHTCPQGRVETVDDLLRAARHHLLRALGRN